MRAIGLKFALYPQLPMHMWFLFGNGSEILQGVPQTGQEGLTSRAHPLHLGGSYWIGNSPLIASSHYWIEFYISRN